MACLDQIEHSGVAVGEALKSLRASRGTFSSNWVPPAHDGLVEWTAQAVPRYLASREADIESRRTAGPATWAVADEWVHLYRHPATDPCEPGVRKEMTAWGRRYVSADGKVRELWMPTYSTRGRTRTPVEIALAAYVCAFGVPSRRVRRPASGSARNILVYEQVGAATPVPEIVRIVDVNCSTGVVNPLREWDANEVRRRYGQEARPFVTQTVNATERHPGNDCADCKALAGCERIPRSPGVLGLGAPARRRVRRSLSASDLRAYRDCPAKYHLTRQLKLRAATEESDAIVRGRAVDEWLNLRHSSADRPTRGCRDLPGPEDPESWSAGEFALAGEVARVGAAMLAQHRAVCPLDGLDTGDVVRVQPTLTCYDPEIDVVLVAKPDLLYTRRGQWVWRETKTTSRSRTVYRSFFEEYLQFAVAVVMIDKGVLDGAPERTGLELEVLHEQSRSLEEIDLGLKETVDEARSALAGICAAWSDDVEFLTRPSTACHQCEAKGFCRDARTA